MGDGAGVQIGGGGDVNDQNKKPRARRISSAEALAWALNLRLRNTTAKFILCALSQYVDGDGICFVSIASIAEDTELSDQTIRSRLAWLEEVGVIARSPQWIDEFGNRNSTGKGRRTSDNIRLMVALNQDQIEERTQNKSRKTPSEVDPQNHQEGEIDPQNLTLSAEEGPPALPPHLPSALPSNCVGGLISEPEPEPESPPKGPPPGDLREADLDSGIKEPEHFLEFWRAYPGHEAMSRFRALEVFVTMSEAEQVHARAASPMLAAVLEKLKRRPRDAHKWLAEKGWQEFPQAKLPSPSAIPKRRMIKGYELAAVMIALRIANLPPLSVVNTRQEDSGETADCSFWAMPIEPDLLALARFSRDASIWEAVIEGGQQFAAWRDRLRAWTGREIETLKIWQEPHNPEIHSLAGSDPAFRPRKFVNGLRVPTPWPPRKDGTLASTPPPETYMTEEDYAELK